ncbi:hypothetical protein QQP08_027141 [Theobroma cacao]|nr:hypothetical protein QQP08_027141 [Theobroma cacao]
MGDFPRSHVEEYQLPLKQRPMVSLVDKWKRPPQGMVKVSSDGAVDLANRSGGLGAIIRDEEGFELGTFYARLTMEVVPLVIEAIATDTELEFAKQHGIHMYRGGR